MSSIELPTISEWLKDKTVFITGASGFIGKVLLEKLLRSCPHVKNIYLLLRTKKGKTSAERLNGVISSPMFDNLKSKHESVFKKIVVVEGDVGLPELGITLEGRKELEENVSVVFHVAASVRFDNTLQQAIYLNTRGTRDVIELSKKMRKLEAMVYVSTAYTNCEHRVIKEKLYPPRADWRKIIMAAEKYDEHTLEIISEKLLNSAPNTYIFTKSLAEQLVYDHRTQLPVVIYRPSVVSSGYNEPIPGWMDNINSLSGICGAVCKGVLRVYGGPKGVEVDYVPVDVAVNGMVASAWYRAVYVQAKAIQSPDIIFNCTTEKAESKELADFGLSVKDSEPMANTLWEPYFIFTNSTQSFLILSLLFHFIPGLIIDSLLKMNGKKPMLLKIYRILYVTSLRLRLFLTTNWNFETRNFDRLNDYLTKTDKKDFFMPRVADRQKLIWQSYHAMRQYIFQEPKEITTEAFAHRRKMYWLDRSCRVLFLIFLLWLIPPFAVYSTFTRVGENIANAVVG